VISIIIPCYNAEATLKATIESALEQNCDKEIIIINDGSTDSSAQLIEMFAVSVRHVRTPNQGASAARNLGTSLANGRFIQYLDSDDLLMPGTLSRRRAALEESGADLAHTDWQQLESLPQGAFALGKIIRPDVMALARDPEAATATSSFWAPPAALLYRRDLVERIGAWSLALPIIQDARFLFDAAVNGARFVYVPGVGAHYRVAANSLSRQSFERFIRDCAVNAAGIEGFWRSRGLLSDQRRRALASMWKHVAIASLKNGLSEFKKARTHYNVVARRSTVIEVGHAMRWMLGPQQAAAFIEKAQRGRDNLRALRRPFCSTRQSEVK
jgi:glycosyltransferase involved in cell wall biosynthesis